VQPLAVALLDLTVKMALDRGAVLLVHQSEPISCIHEGGLVGIQNNFVSALTEIIMLTSWHEPSVALFVAECGVRFAAEALQVVLALYGAIVVFFGGQQENRRGELRGTHLEGQ
jgi:hypothetical protein